MKSQALVCICDLRLTRVGAHVGRPRMPGELCVLLEQPSAHELKAAKKAPDDAAAVAAAAPYYEVTRVNTGGAHPTLPICRPRPGGGRWTPHDR